MVVEIGTLLTEEESEWLDFKREYPGNTAILLHDILCLCNAQANRNRFLVFGVGDDKSIQGVETDQNRKTNANIQDMLRQANLNRIPSITLHCTPVESHEVDILEISNCPVKPFFLTKDKTHGNETIRAGVVYTRIGDTNIPLKESAPDDHIERMWRERFGIGFPPLARVYQLLDDTDNWIAFEVMHGPVYRYHRLSPEFTIQELDDQDGRPLTTKWSRNFPDPEIFRCVVEIRYLGTILKQISLADCDGGRYTLPFPRHQKDGTWQVNADSVEYKVALLYTQYDSLTTALLLCNIQIVHTGDPDAGVL